MGLRTQQIRTIIHMNMHLVSGEQCENNMWPRLRPAYTVPEGLATFEIASSYRNADKFCHFFIDDYRFERVWERPENYLDVLRRYSGVIAPDFSTYTDMPVPMQMWNAYRSRALAHYWQREGIDVIPTIMFSDEASYDWIFDGLPKYSVLVTSSVGVYRNPEWRKSFINGMEEACKRLEPTGLIMYGTKVDFDANGAEVHWYRNDNTARAKENYRRIQEVKDGQDDVQLRQRRKPHRL